MEELSSSDENNAAWQTDLVTECLGGNGLLMELPAVNPFDYARILFAAWPEGSQILSVFERKVGEHPEERKPNLGELLNFYTAAYHNTHKAPIVDLLRDEVELCLEKLAPGLTINITIPQTI